MTNCQEIYQNLLRCIEYDNKSIFIRELDYTKECDDNTDFSKIREKYHKMIGEDPIQRIRNYKETLKDEYKAKQAVFHHKEWTHKSLVNALNKYRRNWFFSM